MQILSSPRLSADVNHSLVYVGSDDTLLHALHMNNGSLAWAFQAKDRIRAAPAVSDDGRFVYACSRDHFLYALSAADGRLLWQFESGGELMSRPVLNADNTLVVIASSDGFAQAQRTPSRKSLRDFSPPSPMAALQL